MKLKPVGILFALIVTVTGVGAQSTRSELTVEGIDGDRMVLYTIDIFGPTLDTLLNATIDARHNTFLIELDGPKIVIASSRKMSAQLYMAPGVSLTMRYDSVKKEILYSQKGAIANNFIKRVHITFGRLAVLKGKSLSHLNEEDFLERINSLQNAYTILYNRYVDSLKIKPPLAADLRRFIDANIVGQKQDYIVALTKRNPESSWLPGLINDVALTKVDLQSVLMQVPDYTVYLTQYYYESILKRFNEGKDEAWGKSHEPSSIPRHVADFIDVEYEKDDRTMREFFQAKNIAFWNSMSGWTNTLDTLTQYFDIKYGSSELKSYLDKQFNEGMILKRGRIAPAISGLNLSNQSVNLTSFKGRVVFIDLWATWCGPCIEAIPDYIKLQKKFADDVVFLNICVSDTPARWHSFISRHPEFTGIHIIDSGSIYKGYFVKSVPRYILIDKSGNIYNAFAPSPSSEELDVEIRLLADKK